MTKEEFIAIQNASECKIAFLHFVGLKGEWCSYLITEMGMNNKDAKKIARLKISKIVMIPVVLFQRDFCLEDVL